MAKGRQFEVEIARILSLNWTDNKNPDIFFHTAGSGSRGTTRRKKNNGSINKNIVGDINTEDIDGKLLIDHWSIECKTGYSKKNSKVGVEYKKETKGKGLIQKEKWFTSIKSRNKWIEETTNKKDIWDINEISGSKENVTPWCLLDQIDSKEENTTFDKFWIQCNQDAVLSGRDPILIFRRPNKSACIAMQEELFEKILDWSDKINPNFITYHGIDDLVFMNLKYFLVWIGNLKDMIEEIYG